MAGIRAIVGVLLAASMLVAVAWVAAAQQLPLPTTQPSQEDEGPTIPPLTSTTTTTAPPPGTSPAPTPPPDAGDPGGDDPGDPGDGTSPGNPDEGADGGDGGGAGRGAIPPEALAMMNSIKRTPANNNRGLVLGAKELEARGLSRDEAVKQAFGRFPVAGHAQWSDDWLYPRWTGATFRFHLGTDLFAAHGTPLRAVDDGRIEVANTSLGGLSVRLFPKHLKDGTYYYYAHLSAVPEDIDGKKVKTGDIVGLVGDSGNARGGRPHLHFSIYVRGKDAAPPKPVLDQWVGEAAARLPELLANAERAQPRALVATALVRTLVGEPRASSLAPAGPNRTELLFASSANPIGGGLHLAEASAAAAAQSVDWDRRRIEQQAFALAWEEAADRARRVLHPLMPATLAAALEPQRSAAGG